MAGSSVTSLRNCSAYPDSSQFYLQLIAPPEASASCLHYSSPSTKNLRSRISVVVSAVKHPLCNSFDAEDVLHCRCKPLWGGFGIKTASPSDCCQVSPMVQAWQCSCKKKTQRRTVVLSGAANSMLDHCSNDTGDFASPSVSYWTEEVLASLRRSLLESQWTLEPADSLLFEDESSSLESCNANKTWEQLNSHLNTQRLGSAVVRSGKASARHRRLASRSRPDSMSQQNIHDGHDNSKDHDFVIPTKFLAKKRRNKVKLDAMQGFLASFLKQSSGCGIHTKEQEKCYTKQFRIFQNLQKARNELKQKLGYDPPYELWARSVNMSVEELRSMVKEGEIARDKLISSHVRLVVSVAKAYRNLGVDISDLVLEGSKGLLRGLEKFDHRKGYKMSTYVHWWIRQGMTRAIADHSRLVRVPVYLHEIMFAIKRAKETLDRRGKPMTVENLSLILNVPTYLIIRALQAKNKVASLDKNYNSYGLKAEFNGLHEFVADPKGAHHPSTMLMRENLMDIVRERLGCLNPRERNVIQWSFGIDMEDSTRSSLTAIAYKLGVSKERVRQIKARALSKMQLAEDGYVQPLVTDLEDL